MHKAYVSKRSNECAAYRKELRQCNKGCAGAHIVAAEGGEEVQRLCVAADDDDAVIRLLAQPCQHACRKLKLAGQLGTGTALTVEVRREELQQERRHTLREDKAEASVKQRDKADSCSWQEQDR